MPDTFYSVDGEVSQGPEDSLEHLVAELADPCAW